MRDKLGLFFVLLAISTAVYAASSVSESRTANEVIRTETLPERNTALRVGSALNGILDAAVLEVSLQSGDFTQQPGYAYSVDTSGGAVTVTADVTPVAGDIFGIYDALGTFGTNSCTVEFGPNSLHALSDPNNTFVGDKNYTHRRFRFDGTRWIIQ